ncbi:MAG: hypothetical protein R2761_17620 [Acidimicrobiales bacterium]
MSGGLLGARLAFLRARLESDERYVWLNRYANPGQLGRPLPHHRTDHRRLPRLDVLFVPEPAPPER